MCICKENYLIKNLKLVLFLKMLEESNVLNKHEPVLSQVFQSYNRPSVFPVYFQYSQWNLFEMQLVREV